MTTRHEWSRERLDRLLEAYGGDTSRWPPGAAAGLDEFLAREPAGRRALAEARALDRLLALAPAASGTEQPLADRIMAHLAKEPVRGKVIEWPGARTAAGGAAPVLPVARGAPAAWQLGRRQTAAAAALLAASLVLGFYLGAAGLTRPALDARSAVAELDGDIVPSVLPPELTDPQDEDVL